MDPTSSSFAPSSWCFLVYLHTTGSGGALSVSGCTSASVTPDDSGVAGVAGVFCSPCGAALSDVAERPSLFHEEPGRPTGGVVIFSPLMKVYLNTGSTISCWLCCSVCCVPSPPSPPVSDRWPASAVLRVGRSTNNDTSSTKDRQKGLPGAGWGGSSSALGTTPPPFPPLPPFSFFLGGILDLLHESVSASLVCPHEKKKVVSRILVFYTNKTPLLKTFRLLSLDLDLRRQPAGAGPGYLACEIASCEVPRRACQDGTMMHSGSPVDALGPESTAPLR